MERGALCLSNNSQLSPHLLKVQKINFISQLRNFWFAYTVTKKAKAPFVQQIKDYMPRFNFATLHYRPNTLFVAAVQKCNILRWRGANGSRISYQSCRIWKNGERISRIRRLRQPKRKKWKVMSLRCHRPWKQLLRRYCGSDCESCLSPYQASTLGLYRGCVQISVRRHAETTKCGKQSAWMTRSSGERECCLIRKRVRPQRVKHWEMFAFSRHPKQTQTTKAKVLFSLRTALKRDRFFLLESKSSPPVGL